MSTYRQQTTIYFRGSAEEKYYTTEKRQKVRDILLKSTFTVYCIEVSKYSSSGE